MEKDFSKVDFKVNASGSWANLVHTDVSNYDEVKAACEILDRASSTGIKFKNLDADGGVIEEYGPVPPNGLRTWHAPRGRRRNPEM